MYGVGGGARAWTCKLCGYKQSGGANKVRAHLLHEQGHEVRMCTKVTPERRQELLEKLVVYEATKVARRSPQVAIDSNLMARLQGHQTEGHCSLLFS